VKPDVTIYESAPTTSRGQARALVVEDSPAMCQEIVAALTSFGYAVTAATTGLEAIRLAEEHPDVMLVDLVLPDLSGLNVCRAIRSRPHTEKIPIIILTADARPKTVVQAFRNGAADFIEKPFVPDVLAHRVNRIVRERVNEVEMARRFNALQEAHAALAAVRADLILQQRLSALGMMASGLAHEMNSPLGALLASLQFVLEGRAENADDVQEALQDALKAGERVAELVRRMRNIAGSDDQTREDVALRRRIELAAAAFPSLQIEVVGDDLVVPVVEAELREAIVAILDNAVRAASKKAEPQVRVTIDADGAFARITVDDNGDGIEAGDVPFVLTPFFTRNRGARAMGLGLSIVDATARRHGGRVVIEGRGPLGGARAMLVLPLSQAQANGTQAESESQAVLHEVAGDGSADA
jgi:signal transduction histidine kinase